MVHLVVLYGSWKSLFDNGDYWLRFCVVIGWSVDSCGWHHERTISGRRIRFR